MEHSPVRLSTPTGTITAGGLWQSDVTCCNGEIVEQYSEGLFGFGLWLGELPPSGDISELELLLDPLLRIPWHLLHTRASASKYSNLNRRWQHFEQST